MRLAMWRNTTYLSVTTLIAVASVLDPLIDDYGEHEGISDKERKTEKALAP